MHLGVALAHRLCLQASYPNAFHLIQTDVIPAPVIHLGGVRVEAWLAMAAAFSRVPPFFK